MYGLIRAGCLSIDIRPRWRAGFCGLCRALGREFGQPARMAVNGDATVVALLTAAQMPFAEPVSRSFSSHWCPFRTPGFLALPEPDTPAMRYGAAAALIMAVSKIRDHLTDRDSMLKWGAPFLDTLHRNWRQKASKSAAKQGLDIRPVLGQTEELIRREGQSGLSLSDYTAPVAHASGMICAHTARIAGREENRSALTSLGRHFGRILYLADALRDRERDHRSGAFNPLDACRESDANGLARRICKESANALAWETERLNLECPDPVRLILTGGIGQAASCLLADGNAPSDKAGTDVPLLQKKRQNKSGKRPRKDRFCCDGFCDACCDGICTNSRTGGSWCGICRGNPCRIFHCCDCDACDGCDCDCG